MLKITYIEKNPERWIIHDTGKYMNGTKLLAVKYGKRNNYPMGIDSLEMLMRECVYNKAINKQLIVSPSHNGELVLIDAISRRELKKLCNSIY